LSSSFSYDDSFLFLFLFLFLCYQRLLRVATLIYGLVTPFQIHSLLNMSDRTTGERLPGKDLKGSCHDHSDICLDMSWWWRKFWEIRLLSQDCDTGPTGNGKYEVLWLQI